MSSDRYEASRNHVEAFAKWVATTENESILSLNPIKWQDFYDWLGEQIAKQRKWRAGGKKGTRDGYSPAYARDIFNSTRLFMEWLGEIGQMSIPGNIRSKKMVFRVPKKKIETFSLEEVRVLVAGCSDKIGGRTKLYLLLMLNCGMYQSDISDLVWSEFDAKRGTITRKRSKTDDFENCPEVTWYLWPETLRLLKKYANQDKTILNQKKTADTGTICVSLLVTAKGGPLVAKKLKEEKGTKSDNIKSAYVRLAKRLKVATKPLMLIRKTSSSLLGEHKDYKFYAQYFLAQARKQPPMVIMSNRARLNSRQRASGCGRSTASASEGEVSRLLARFANCNRRRIHSRVTTAREPTATSREDHEIGVGLSIRGNKSFGVPMSLFDEFERTDTSYSLYSETSYGYLNRSARLPEGRIRSVIDKWFSEYPPEHQHELKRRFQSKNPWAYESAFFELALHAMLRRLGCELEVHPDIPGASTHPEFVVRPLVGSEFILEAVLASGQNEDEIVAEKTLRDDLRRAQSTGSVAWILFQRPRSWGAKATAVRQENRRLCVRPTLAAGPGQDRSRLP